MNNPEHVFDILIVGAGPAGMAAAIRAASAGKRVGVIDNSPWLGGQIWRGEQAHPHDSAAQQWLQRFRESGAQVFSSTTVFAAPAPHVLLAETPKSVEAFAWKKLIIATGARELFVPFPGWTLPGVYGPGGLHAMAKAGWPVKGKRIVVAGSGPLLLAVADGLKQHGADVTMVAEQASFSSVMAFGIALIRYPGKLLQGAGVKSRLLGVPCKFGLWPLRAEGKDHVEKVVFTDGTTERAEACDYLACGFHLVPNLELSRLLGCEVTQDRVRVGNLQETSVADVYCAGEPTGVGGVDCSLAEGQIAGLAAAGQENEAARLFGERARWHRFRDSLASAFALRPELRQVPNKSTVVCRCEDVTRGQLDLHRDWRDAKLHTRCGMGPCQGRTCGASVRFLFGWENESVRAPIFPVRTGSLVCATTFNINTTDNQPKKGQP